MAIQNIAPIVGPILPYICFAGLVRNLCMLLVLCLTAANATAVFAAELDLAWQYAGSMNYEPRNPELGVSHKYISSAGWIDVYIYSNGRCCWVAGISDPEFSAHFESIVEVLRLYAMHDVYHNLKIGAVQDVTIATQVFRTVISEYILDSQPLISSIYLTARNGQLLKYRISLYATGPLDIEAVSRSFIERDLDASATTK